MLNDVFTFEGCDDAFKGFDNLKNKIKRNQDSKEQYMPFYPIHIKFSVGRNFSQGYNEVFPNILSIYNTLHLFGAIRCSIVISSELDYSTILISEEYSEDNYFLDVQLDHTSLSSIIKGDWGSNLKEYSAPYKVIMIFVSYDYPSPATNFLIYFGVDNIYVPNLGQKIFKAKSLDVKKDFRYLLQDELQALTINMTEYRVDKKLYNESEARNEYDPMDNYDSKQSWDDAFGDAPDSAIGHW